MKFRICTRLHVSFLLFIMALGLISAGCAVHEYKHYAKGKAKIAEKEAEVAKAAMNMFQQAMAHTIKNPAVQGMLAMAQAMWLMQRRPVSLEQPKAGPLEAGVGTAIPQLVKWGGLAGMLLAAGGSNGGDTTNYNQSISGDGSAGVIGGGSAEAYTSPPTVVTQPEPVIVPPAWPPSE